MPCTYVACLPNNRLLPQLRTMIPLLSFFKFVLLLGIVPHLNHAARHTHQLCHHGLHDMYLRAKCIRAAMYCMQQLQILMVMFCSEEDVLDTAGVYRPEDPVER